MASGVYIFFFFKIAEDVHISFFRRTRAMAGVVPLKGLNWSPGMVDEILTSLLAKECQTCVMLFTLRALKICDGGWGRGRGAGGGGGGSGGRQHWWPVRASCGTALVACKSVIFVKTSGVSTE